MSFSPSNLAPETPFAGPVWWVAALWLALAIIFQSTVAHYFVFRDAIPSAVLVVVVWYAMRVDARRAALYGFVAGLFEDILSGGTGGAWTVATTIVAIVVSIASRNFFADSFPVAAATTVLATLVRNLEFWTMRAFERYPQGLGWVHFHQTLWQAILNGLLMLLALLLYRWRENYRTT